MQIELAKSAGFCFGVKRAVDKVYAQLKEGGIIYTYGPIIHNDEVVSDLKEKGVKVLNGREDIENSPAGCVIIRSHGVSKSIYELLEKNGHTVVDATCPFVLKIHRIVEKESAEGKSIIIVGNDGHPEVEGIKGWCSREAFVIGSTEEALQLLEKLDADKSYCLVAQTTFNGKKFKDIVEILTKKEYSVSAVSTICSATQERQSEAREIAARVPVMIVIGDNSSSNSRKLYEICREECEDTHFIQTLDDLNLEVTKSIPCVGITAGASTPKKIIEEVQNYVRINF